MLAKISTVVYLIAAILHFKNGQVSLFWVSVMLGIGTTGLSIYKSYRQVSPQLKEYRHTVKQMEADGASDEEIITFMNQDIDVDESKLQDSPGWMVLVAIAGVIASFVLGLWIEFRE